MNLSHRVIELDSIIHNDVQYEYDGIFCDILRSGELLIDIGGLDIESPKQLALLKRIKAALPAMHAHLNIDHLQAILDGGVSHQQYLIERYGTGDGEKILDLWLERSKEQDLYDIGDDDLITAELVKAKAVELLRIKEWQAMLPLARSFKEKHQGFVYLFHLRSTKYYKIGLSISPEQRGKQITAGLPIELDLLHTIPSNQIKCLEGQLHHKYQDRRYKGKRTEWFALKKEEVSEIKSLTEVNYEWVDNSEYWDWVNREQSTAIFSRPTMMTSTASPLFSKRGN